METQERINALESRQLELQAKMKSLDYITNKISDAYYLHSATAAREVANSYRAKLEEREAWRSEYNENEETLAALYAQRAQEEAETDAEEREE